MAEVRKRRKIPAYKHPKKRQIALDMLMRYTGADVEQIQKYVVLTNFQRYLKEFAQEYEAEITTGSVMQAAHSEALKLSMIDIKVGAPSAALIIELLSANEPQAVLFLGMCGGLHHSLNIGDFILPMAAIRDEGVSRHYIPPQVPSLPTFKIQKFVSQILLENGHDYHTGVVHTTDYRFWEFDEQFKQELYEERAIAIDMECAALFSVGFVSKVPIGALLLVSDLPLKEGGIKTTELSRQVFDQYTHSHVQFGIRSMIEIQKRGERIRHYRW